MADAVTSSGRVFDGVFVFGDLGLRQTWRDARDHDAHGHRDRTRDQQDESHRLLEDGDEDEPERRRHDECRERDDRSPPPNRGMTRPTPPQSRGAWRSRPRARAPGTAWPSCRHRFATPPRRQLMAGPEPVGGPGSAPLWGHGRRSSTASARVMPPILRPRSRGSTPCHRARASRRDRCACRPSRRASH
jgi:hypothetical protein